MMVYLLYALTLICLVLGLAVVRRCTICSPLVINASIWLMVFIIGIIFQERFYPLQEKALIAWMLWFMVTSSIFFFLSPSRVKCELKEAGIRQIPIDYTLPLLLLIIWLSYRIWIVGSAGPEDFFLNLRWSNFNLEGFVSYGLVRRFYPLIFALFLFEHLYARRENLHLRVLLWIWMLLYGLSTMGKFQILTTLLSWTIIQRIKNEMNAKKFFLLASILFALGMSIQFVRGDLTHESTLGNLFALYIYSPIVAFGYMDIDSSMPFGAYVFRFFYALGNILEIAPQPAEIILPWVEIPMLTNVYTIFFPFYHDFGMLGVFLQATIYGLFFSFLFIQAIKKRGLWLILYSGYSIVLVGQFIGDFLIMMLSVNLQFLIYSIAVFLFSRKIHYIK